MRKGLGKVESVDGRLVWTFTAPHLGYWMAAPLTPPSGERRWNLLCNKRYWLVLPLQSTLGCDLALHLKKKKRKSID